MVNMISRIIRVMAESPHLWQVMRLVCPGGGNVTAWHGHWTVVKLGGHSTVFVSNYRLTFRLFILYLLSVCSLFALIKSKYFLIFMIDTTPAPAPCWGWRGWQTSRLGWPRPPPCPPGPTLGCFPWGSGAALWTPCVCLTAFAPTGTSRRTSSAGTESRPWTWGSQPRTCSWRLPAPWPGTQTEHGIQSHDLEEGTLTKMWNFHCLLCMTQI